MSLPKYSKDYELTIIFVNYKSSLLIDDCLKSLTLQMYKNFNVIIVDNSPGNNEYIKLKKLKTKYEKYIEIVLLKPKYNLGFAGGNNYAIKISNSEFLLLLNCDMELAPHTLQKSIDYLKNNFDVGLLSPKILFFNDKKRIWYAGSYLNPKSFEFSYHIGWNQKDQGQYDQIKETAYANGAALFIRQEVVNKIGLMDEIFFMYAEETDWNYRAKKNKYKIIYYPGAVVYHKVDLIKKENKLGFRENAFQVYLYTRNKIIFTLKHFSIMTFVIFLIKFELKTTLIEIFLSIIKRNLEFTSSQIRAIFLGLIIGIKRRTNRSCKKLMIKEMKYLRKFTKISRSTQF